MLEDPDGKEESHLRYLDQEKYDYIQNYLEQATEQTKDHDVDAHNVMEESDSGKPGSSNVPSEVGTEETSGKLTIFLYKPSEAPPPKGWSQIAHLNFSWAGLTCSACSALVTFGS